MIILGVGHIATVIKLSCINKGAAGTVAAGAAGQHGGRKCPFPKNFLVYPLHLKLLTHWATANALHPCQKLVFGVLSKTSRRVDEYTAGW